MTDASIQYDVTDRVGTLLFSKPPVNAPTFDEVELFRETLETIPRENELVVVLESGGSKTFIGGHNLNEFETTTAENEREGTDTYLAFLEALYELPIPSVAAKDGAALGTGLVVTCFCDLRVISPSAELGLPEIRVGASAGYRPIRRHFPDGVARHLALTGQTIDGERAYELGFASVLSEEPKKESRELAQEIASKSPDAVESVTALANRHQPDWPIVDFRRERRRTEELLLGENAQEAIAAFLEDRSPKFEG